MTETLKVTLDRRDTLAVVFTEGYINNQGGEEIARVAYELIAQPRRKSVAAEGLFLPQVLVMPRVDRSTTRSDRLTEDCQQLVKQLMIAARLTRKPQQLLPVLGIDLVCQRRHHGQPRERGPPRRFLRRGRRPRTEQDP
jgi:hypothetical protein